MDTKGLNLGASVKADIPLSTGHTLRLGGEAQRYRLDDWWPPSPSVLPPGYAVGGMAPDTFININNGRRDRLAAFAEWEASWSPRWRSLLGIRSDNVLMNTGAVHGYNDTMMYNGPPLYPATTFNGSDRKRTDRQPRPDGAEPIRAAADARLRGGLRQKDPFAEPLRALRLVDEHDGDGDGQPRRGRQLLCWQSRPEAGDGPYPGASANWHDASAAERGISVTPYYTLVQDYINARRCPTTVCGSSAAVMASTTATRGFVYLQFVNQASEL